MRFPWLPIEDYTEEWLEMIGDEIGKTIKVENTTLAISWGKFARVCVELDLGKPLLASYRLRMREWRLQYESLHDLCFSCGKYGPKEVKCPLMTATKDNTSNGEENNARNSSGEHD